MKITLIIGPQSSGKTWMARNLIGCAEVYKMEQMYYSPASSWALPLKLYPTVSFILADDIPNMEAIQHVIGMALEDCTISNRPCQKEIEIKPHWILVYQSEYSAEMILPMHIIKRISKIIKTTDRSVNYHS